MGSPPLWKCVATLSAFLVSFSRVTNVHGSAVMSIDISSEWMTVVALSSDVPLEKAISKESMGKIASAVAFVNGERLFGEDALELGIYHPSDCYMHFFDLVGKKVHNPVVQQYKKRFPQHKIVPHPERNTVLFKRSDSNELFSPEDLVAMLLEEAKDLARNLTKENVNEAVISVPNYFAQAERLAMLIAADISGIEVIQLINSCTAAALNYGTLHTDKFYKTAPVYMMFFNMDSYGTQASIVSYQLVNSEDKTDTDTKLQPQLTVLGVGYERSLGGLEMQLRLRDYLASTFNSLKLTSNDVSKDPTSMARLFIEAGRLKGALSTNTEHLVRVKNLIDEKDLEIKVTRDEMNELCYDIFDQVVLTAQEALESSGHTTELIEEVILIGAATEVPRVQERLLKDLKLSRSLDTDGAVVLGAAYKAAAYGDGFKVKPFITKDAILFPVQVLFHQEGLDDSYPPNPVRRILFGHMDTYPKHHFITFNKYQGDIIFDLDYINNHINYLDENKIRGLGSMSLARFNSVGVQEAYSRYKGQEGVDAKGIEVCISIDVSGLIIVPRVKLLVEKTITKDKTRPISDSNILKVITVKEEITVYNKHFFVVPLRDEMLKSIDKSKKLKHIDLVIAKKRKSLHNLLEAIYDTHLKLNKSEYASAFTDTEKKTILDKRIELSNWLASGGTDAEIEELDSKYDELKKLVMPVWTRVSEHSERPIKLEALNNVLDSSNLLLKEIKMITLKDVPFTQLEIDTFEKLIAETTSWRDDLVKKQEKHPKNVDPVLTIEKIEMYHSSLESELNKFTSLKLKIKEPLKKFKNPKAETSKLETDDKKSKMIEEQDNDDIVKTKISQDDRVEEFDKNEENITEEVDVDSNNKIKAKESWLGWLPDLIRKTSQNDEL